MISRSFRIILPDGASQVVAAMAIAWEMVKGFKLPEATSTDDYMKKMLELYEEAFNKISEILPQ